MYQLVHGCSDKGTAEWPQRNRSDPDVDIAGVRPRWARGSFEGCHIRAAAARGGGGPCTWFVKRGLPPGASVSFGSARGWALSRARLNVASSAKGRNRAFIYCQSQREDAGFSAPLIPCVPAPEGGRHCVAALNGAREATQSLANLNQWE